MSFDAYLVSFGLARVLTTFGVAPALAYQTMVATALIDARLLWAFFRDVTARKSDPGLEAPPLESPIRASA
jgi:hypothetical protein